MVNVQSIIQLRSVLGCCLLTPLPWLCCGCKHGMHQGTQTLAHDFHSDLISLPITSLSSTKTRAMSDISSYALISCFGPSCGSCMTGPSPIIWQVNSTPSFKTQLKGLPHWAAVLCLLSSYCCCGLPKAPSLFLPHCSAWTVTGALYKFWFIFNNIIHHSKYIYNGKDRKQYK